MGTEAKPGQGVRRCADALYDSGEPPTTKCPGVPMWPRRLVISNLKGTGRLSHDPSGKVRSEPSRRSPRQWLPCPLLSWETPAPLTLKEDPLPLCSGVNTQGAP